MLFFDEGDALRCGEAVAGVLIVGQKISSAFLFKP
jgi:hypothetical protein